MSVYKLIADANKAAQFRKHSLRWSLLESNRARGVCVNCDRFVYVNTKPEDNEIDIIGPSIFAVNCNGSKA